MSELKTRFIDDAYVEYCNTGKHELAQIYLKSEADKVIAHNKYKRCLAMASSCSDKASAEYASSYVSCDEYYYHHAEFWNKWHKRWLKLAEKFKPNNSTAQ